jgi:hypothetical protein
MSRHARHPASILNIFANIEKGRPPFMSRFAAVSLISNLIKPGIMELVRRAILHPKQTRLRCGSRLPYLMLGADDILGNLAPFLQNPLPAIETGWAKSNLIAIRIDDPLSIRYLVSYRSIVIFLGIPHKIFFYQIYHFSTVISYEIWL